MGLIPRLCPHVELQQRPRDDKYIPKHSCESTGSWKTRDIHAVKERVGWEGREKGFDSLPRPSS